MTWAKRRAIIVTVVILFFAAIIWAALGPRELMGKSVLVMDVNGDIEDQAPLNPFALVTGNRPSVLQDYIGAIDSARTDPRITGLVVRIGDLGGGWAKIEELRSHLLAFRASRKPNICYLGYDGIGNPEYYLASACSQVWLVPTNSVSITGMMAQALFLRGSLDKLKVVPEVYHIAEFKTAYNTYTEKKFTPAHREEVESVLGGVFNQYVTETAAARRIDRAKFQALVATGPFSGREAVHNELIDRLAYWDQVQDYFKERGGWNPITLERYGNLLRRSSGPRIAVVYATGEIASGDSGSSPTSGTIMGGDTIAAALRSARQDKGVRAIVLRVDSGGGSVVASEVIRREVELAEAQKPVVVSMADLAASGGYWISVPAAKIVAEPDTETGSIGVLAGKMNIAGLYSLLGLSTDYVATSENATLFSEQQNFTPAQQAYIQKTLQETYDTFTRTVAADRHLSVEAVDKIAKGRVWTGEQAKQLGLVDYLGGLDRAIAVAKELANIPERQSVSIQRLPRQKSLLDQLLQWEEDQISGRTPSLAAALQQILGTMEPVQARVPYVLHIR
ncbi:MAG: signal peptide peptidase SppA [Acidobacteriota bacterium]|nr:signal peptide peptidase SppA [Acidobacteriota bacterium]